MEKIKNLRLLKSELRDFQVKGLSNFKEGEINIFVANHNCIMDIFYLPMAIPEEVVSMISARLLFKKDGNRQDVINEYLNGLPIEAHGGKEYASLCLDAGVDMLNNGQSICIFPEGAYVEEDIIYRGRTGAARMLFQALDNGVTPNFIPVSIGIKNPIEDLDDYMSRSDEVEVSILDKIEYADLYDFYSSTSSFEEKNKALHMITDKAMESIATNLGKPYQNEYITLRPKGNVIYSDGTTLSLDEAKKVKHLSRYSRDLQEMQRNIVSNISR